MKFQETYIILISYLITFICISIIIPLNLFPCFFSGFLTYEIIVSFSSIFEHCFDTHKARRISATLIIIIISMITTISIINCTNFFTEDIINTIDITNEINRIFSDLKTRLPNSLPFFLPDTAEELKNQIFNWIESNITLIRNMGHTFIHGCITLFIGLIIAIFIACTTHNTQYTNNTYFINQLLTRVYTLSQAFHNIVFAQIKISSVNTFLTSIMIFVIFPLFSQPLPLKKTLIIITFILGLLPIIGNIISNVLITIAALSISLSMGVIMFIYLVLIHKLEYFLNAEIIGNKINANPWELILAMLLLESIFGIEGLIAAPVYYAYLKSELRLNNMI